MSVELLYSHLEQYDFQRDLENRMRISQLTKLDVQVLEEILHSSLSISINELSREFSVSKERFFESIQKLSRTHLFARHGDQIIVDKELRKYFELQISRFSSHFSPNIAFIQQLISYIPIDLIPIWYDLSLITEDIFQSILEKFFLSPALFQRHYQEAENLPTPLKEIVHEVYYSANFCLSTHALERKFKLSKLDCKRFLLFLEYGFFCFVQYLPKGEHWEEVVVPFHGWVSYQNFLKKNQLYSLSLSSQRKLKKRGESSFAFIEELTFFLLEIQTNPLIWQEQKSLSSSSFLMYAERAIFSSREDSSLHDYDRKEVISKAVSLKMIDLKDQRVYISESGRAWLEQENKQKALGLYLYSKCQLEKLFAKIFERAFQERDLLSIERELKRVIHLDWVNLELFINGMSEGIGDGESVVLKRDGKNWSYTFPKYTKKQSTFVHQSIVHYFFEAGLVNVGRLEETLYFCLTDLGKELFSE